ncbi:MAG: hypothetical protein AABZ31_10970, partial [Bdellovibrionota bacterium]
MANLPIAGILILSSDIRVAKDMQAAAVGLAAPLRILPCSTGQKFTEYGSKEKLAAIFIDEAFNKPLTTDWVNKIRASLSKNLGNDRAPIFLLKNECDFNSGQVAVLQGYVDIFLKPIDVALIFQKLQLYIPKIGLLKNDMLFSMNVRDEVNMAVTGTMIQASEYGAIILCDRKFNSGDVLTFGSE